MKLIWIVISFPIWSVLVLSNIMVMCDVDFDTLCKNSAELQEFPRVLVISPTLSKAKYASVYAVELFVIITNML